MSRIADRRRSVHLAPVADVDREPSVADLAEIEREWPLIEAELAVVEAEVALVVSPECAVAHRAHRRAVRRVSLVAARLAAGGVSGVAA